MYIPTHFKESDEHKLIEFMQSHSFATLISTNNNNIRATHLPFVIERREEKTFLVTHLAKANPQWQDFLQNESLVIFQGPHAYISPTHYEKKQNVPTWNYIAVHAYGNIKLIEEPPKVIEVLEKMIKTYELNYYDQWKLLPPNYINGMVKEIIAFEIDVIRLEGKFKLSQNKTKNERQNIIDTFRNSNDSQHVGIAEEMKKENMKNIFITFSIIFSSSKVFAQLPNTDIWLMDVKMDTDTIIFSNPFNITDRNGYDNQPAFSPDGSSILYTSVRDGKQSDIYEYDLKTKTTKQITKTKTSEYSPTIMPDGKNISVVMVEPDSIQRLWKFPINGGKPTLIMKNIDSIGYHCWINKDSLALIMITEPPTLQVANVKTQQTKLIASNVSRCIQPKINQHTFYYLRNNFAQDSTWLFTDSYQMKTNDLSLPANSQDYYCFETAEIPPIVIYACNNIIWGFYKDTYEVICRYDLSTIGITGITRMTMSKDGKKIAIVAELKK